jgi:hypothetical protein
MCLGQLLIHIGYSGLRADGLCFFMGVVLTRIGMARSHHYGFFFEGTMSFPQTVPNCWYSFLYGDVSSCGWPKTVFPNFLGIYKNNI